MANEADDGDELALERRQEGRVAVYRVRRAGAPLRWSQLAEALAPPSAVATHLTASLRDCPHEAVFWECRPWREEADPVFEYALVPTSAFGGRAADPRAFSAHFGGAPVAAFDSLGKDARLVAPSPAAPRDAALHLLSFVRHAPSAQVRALWAAVGEEVAAWRAATRGPLWLSTSGLGVPWLHVRLDSRPKYYTHAPYR